MKRCFLAMVSFFIIFSISSTGYCSYEIGIGTENISPSTDEIASKHIYLGSYGVSILRGHAPGFMTPFCEGTGHQFRQHHLCPISSRYSRYGHKNHRTNQKRCTQTNKNPSKQHFHHQHPHTFRARFSGAVGRGIRIHIMRFVINKTSDAIVRAYQSKRKAIIKVSSGVGSSYNRRGGNVTDLTMTTMEFIDIVNSSTLGIFVNFAAHPTILDRHNRMISRDWPGYLTDFLESKTNAPVIFTNGIFGDVSPIGKMRTFERARSYGESMGEVALESMKNSVRVSNGITIATEHFTLPLDNLIFRFVCALKEIDYDCRGDFISGYTFDTETSYISLGDQVELAMLPGEPLTSNGLAIKNAMQTPYKIIIGQTNGSMGHLIPSEEYNNWYDTEELTCLNLHLVISHET